MGCRAQSFGCCRGESRKFAMPGLGLRGHLSQKKQTGKSQKIPDRIQKKGAAVKERLETARRCCLARRRSAPKH